jgi:hypothetical protein
VRFEVLRALSMKMKVFWDIVLCSLHGVHQRFRCAYWRRLHGAITQKTSHWWWMQYAHLKRQSTPARLHGAISQKTLIFKQWQVSTENVCVTYDDLQLWYRFHTPSLATLTRNIHTTVDTGPIGTILIMNTGLPSSPTSLQATRCACKVQEVQPTAVHNILQKKPPLLSFLLVYFTRWYSINDRVTSECWYK